MKHRPYFSRHPHRPPWWPENEEWPPRDPRNWRRIGRHSPFFRRLGCLFAIFNLLGLAVFMIVAGFILNALGFTNLSIEQFYWLLPFGGIFLVFLIMMIFVAGRNLRRMSMPLDDLLSASNRVADGDYSVRVDERGWPEVRSMARAFNSMAEKLQVTDQHRRNMLADVSHELRTPITVMQGNLEGMMDGVYPADETRLKSLFEETQILSRLVDDLRTLSLAEAGALQLRREPTDLAGLIRETVAAFESQTKGKNVRLNISLQEIEPIEIDPQRVREVLTNLLVNALRYTPKDGAIRIDLSGSTLGEERSVQVSVQDSGPGIESADLSRIFDRYYRSSDSGGMGLGLSIAKYLVEAHDGKIWAESQAGRGATISFALPY